MQDRKISFPNEIHNLIINEIGFEYYAVLTTNQLYTPCPTADTKIYPLKALSAYRLVSHLFSFLATPFMFSTIILTYHKTRHHAQRRKIHSERLRGLLHILNDNDNFFSSTVRTLDYYYEWERFGNLDDGAIFYKILSQLPRIQNFSFGPSIADSRIKYPEIAQDFTSAIRNLCRSPFLTILGLRNIKHFPITIITACPNLRVLRLQRMTDLSHDSMSSPQDDDLLYLDSLEIDDESTRALLKSDIPPLSECLSRLKRLRLLRVGFKVCGTRATMVKKWAQTLTHLDICYILDPFPVADNEELIDLARLPALRSLKVHFILVTSEVSLPTYLHHFFNLPSAPTGIKAMEISIFWQFPSGYGGQRPKDIFFPEAGWSKLDQILASEKYPSLEQVVFDFRIRKANIKSSPIPKNGPLMHSMIDTLFPVVKASKRVRYSLRFTKRHTRYLWLDGLDVI
ncbi:hypothetical protein BYT27DRAFT_7343513 [Phlegmacium glaucopus]|nr:hypothetical protein BYT27DRAFT_7343513 [Phlegmacium glaucopus]